jgi:redox-sensitive bicupin YhaK (pirin superfamily)
MIKIRRSDERGHADRGWLKGYFSFSFADYYDPEYMGFRALRVLNDDRIAPGRGFGPHAHRDMEIITYVLDGHLLHRDSMGEQHVLGPNEVQTMSAGTGIVHSEFNNSETEAVHSIQIWIQPKAEDITPSYQQIAFPPEEKLGRFRLLAAPNPNAGPAATTINQDTWLYVAELPPKETAARLLPPDRHGWVQVVRGEIFLNGQLLREGDGAAISHEEDLSFAAGERSGELLYFDLS